MGIGSEGNKKMIPTSYGATWRGTTMGKDHVSNSYIERQKAIHGKKPLAERRSALIIGADPGNIGDAIKLRLLGDGIGINCPHVLDFDVRSPPEKFVNSYDILILANGYTKLNWFEDNTHENIQHTFDVNVIGSLKTANQFVKNTIDKPYKKYIVFIGSMAYRNVLNGSAAYCASKAALAMATKCLAWELAPKGYNVFCVHPSNTEGTPMTERTITGLMRYRNLDRERAEAYWGAVLPKDKWLQPDDIAETVSFLVSGKADYQSGANVELAGGQR
jgi:NAD(P)-dependent dehydrogenase (short-subunit alcohol dehydrogenase family)